MVLAVAFDEAVKRRVTRVHPHKAAGTTQTAFFGFPDQPDLPHACLNELVPGHSSTTHFHVRDQFQVVVGGKGTLGRHELAPYRVHFSRAYTPYGPLISDAGDGLKFFVMRAHRDIGSQRELSRLQDMPDRRPWQATCALSFPTTHTADTVLESISDIKDEEGLAAYALSMKPGTHARAPDHSHGDGQYLLVLKGSVLHEGKELKGYALIFITPQEAAYQIQAGAQGASILVLNFPERVVRAKAATHSADADFKTWQCALCSFVYDEAQGLPEEGIAPGTRWQEVPEAWSCPDCAASKSDFQMTELVKT